jgi:secreted trypsin-like serine protease
MRRLLTACIAVTLLLCSAVSPAGAITNGQPDDNWHPYVGLITDYQSYCSGTLISPTVLLTAAHCITGFGGPDYASSVVVSFAPDDAFSNTQATASAMYVEPLGFDVGVVILNEDMGHLGQGYLPAEGAVDWLSNKTPLTAVGYGFTGYTPGGGPPQPAGDDGTRLYATTEFINNNHNYAPQFMKLSTNPGQGKGGTCFGDSGGPIFADDQFTILGIASWGGSNCNGLSYAQRMDLYEVLTWVYEFL